MGSSTHIQGVPQRPGLASRRDGRAVAARRRELEADIREAIYVRPLGRGIHLVKNLCNDTPYRVGSRAGITFSPGSRVLLGSNTGHPGETIIAEPPPGRRGASLVGTVTGLRSFAVEVEDAGADPCDLTYHLGHDYTAIHVSGAVLDAWLYRDGDYSADLASTTLGSAADAQLYGAGYVYGDSFVEDYSVIWFRTTHQQKLFCWELDSNIVHSLNLPNSLTDTTVGWAYVGGWIYYVRRSSTEWKLRKVRADLTGDVAVSTLARTAGYSDPFAIVSASQMNILDSVSANVRIVSLPLDGSAGAQGDDRSWSGKPSGSGISAASYLVGSRGRQLYSWNPSLNMADVGDTGDEILHYPDGWIGGPLLTQNCAAPTPDRSAWTSYLAGTGIFRWPLDPDPDGHCPAPIIEVAQHASVDPDVMLPRN